MKYAVVTFGCRVNQADSVDIERQLRALGGSPVPPGEADMVVVNTCSVTATADHGARQTIRRIARTNPAARIVATGCYASRAGDAVAALPGVTDIVNNRDKERLADRLRLAVDRHDGRTVRRWGRRLRRCDPAGHGGADGLHAARADGLRPDLRLLHHSRHARGRPQRGAGARIG